MSEALQRRFEKFQLRYEEGELPWDVSLPPPEIIDVAARLPPGRALDLGSGFGRTCIYLAEAGWEVDGIDFIPEATREATERVRAAGLADRIRLHTASVTDLGFLDQPYDLAIDVGCMHGLAGDDLRSYAAELARLVRPDGWYLLYAHLQAGPEDTAPASIPEATVMDLFRDAFSFTEIAHGVTEVCGRRWASAWFWMRRIAAP